MIRANPHKRGVVYRTESSSATCGVIIPWRPHDWGSTCVRLPRQLAYLLLRSTLPGHQATAAGGGAVKPVALAPAAAAPALKPDLLLHHLLSASNIRR